MHLVPEPLYAAPLFSLSGELWQLHFHLNLENRGAAALRVERVTVEARRGAVVLARSELEAPALAQRLRPVPFIVVRDRQTVAAAHRWRGALARPMGATTIARGAGAALTQIALLLRPGELPDRLRCIVRWESGVAEREVPVRRHAQRTRLRLPFAGPWWVMAGHRFDEDHATGVMASQAFAYDLGVLGVGAATFRGDTRRNSSYHAHDQPIRAAADGDVVQVHDGVRENEPVGARPAWEDVLRQPEDLAGNFVVLHHAAGEHTAYLHLRSGLTARVGARVRAGDELGRCGNSGNSLEAHLHFQLQDGPDPLRAAGLPALFSDFTLHLAHLRLYVPPERAAPLPVWLVVEPGRAAGAATLRLP